MDCPKLPGIIPGNWDDLDSLFTKAARLELKEPPGAEPRTDFRPGEVRFGWNDSGLVVRALLHDDHPCTQAEKDNDHIWALGDAFELFLRDLSKESYVELHVAPNARTLQIRFPDREAIQRMRAGESNLENHKLAPGAFTVATRAREDLPGWEVVAIVPVETVAEEKKSLPGSEWLVSFSRYDAVPSGDKDPILSSTSPHEVVNFHRQEEWRRIRFED